MVWIAWKYSFWIPLPACRPVPPPGMPGRSAAEGGRPVSGWNGCQKQLLSTESRSNANSRDLESASPAWISISADGAAWISVEFFSAGRFLSAMDYHLIPFFFWNNYFVLFADFTDITDYCLKKSFQPFRAIRFFLRNPRTVFLRRFVQTNFAAPKQTSSPGFMASGSRVARRFPLTRPVGAAQIRYLQPFPAALNSAWNRETFNSSSCKSLPSPWPTLVTPSSIGMDFPSSAFSARPSPPCAAAGCGFRHGRFNGDNRHRPRGSLEPPPYSNPIPCTTISSGLSARRTLAAPNRSRRSANRVKSCDPPPTNTTEPISCSRIDMAASACSIRFLNCPSSEPVISRKRASSSETTRRRWFRRASPASPSAVVRADLFGLPPAGG